MAEPRVQRMKVSFGEDELARLKARMRAAGKTSVSRFLRETALNGHTAEPTPTAARLGEMGLLLNDLQLSVQSGRISSRELSSMVDVYRRTMIAILRNPDRFA